MNLRTRAVRHRDESVHLSPTEFQMLHVLLVNANRISSNHQIHRVVYGTGTRPDTVQARIGRTIGALRRKLGDRDRTLIRTAHGIGYRLVGRTPLKVMTGHDPIPR